MRSLFNKSFCMFSQTALTLTFGLKDDVLKLCTRFDIIDWFPDVRNVE